MTDLYNSDDDNYKNVPLKSTIPPPHRNDAANIAEDEFYMTYKNPTRSSYSSASLPTNEQEPQRSSEPEEKARKVTSEEDDVFPQTGTITGDNMSDSRPKSFAEKIMEKSGWQSGQGLGKFSQGRVEPIRTETRDERMGLGYVPVHPTITKRTHTIDRNRFIPHKQEPKWLISQVPYEPHTVFNTPDRWIGPSDEAIDYNLFCDVDLVNKLMQAKSSLDHIPSKEFRVARKKANPYEAIGKHIFQNRAALKMANLDHLFDLTSSAGNDTYLYFADICGGPGGFTEYIYWRKKDKAKGWGITLKGPYDWKLHIFRADASHDNFEIDYGEDGTGDILKSQNIRHFANRVLSARAQGVDLVMGDGGIGVEGEENFQEFKVQRLILCQFLIMFNILAKGGKFACKIFDVFTPFTVGLIYILYRHFERICIIKPYTSRPANSERYVICFNLLEQKPPVTDYLFAINEQMSSLHEGESLLYPVNIEMILRDTEFCQYMRESNISHARKQIEALEEIIKFVEDKELLPLDQNDVKRRCLEEWNLPLEEKLPSKNSRDAAWDAFSRKRRASSHFRRDEKEFSAKRMRTATFSKDSFNATNAQRDLQDVRDKQKDKDHTFSPRKNLESSVSNKTASTTTAYSTLRLETADTKNASNDKFSQRDESLLAVSSLSQFVNKGFSSGEAKHYHMTANENRDEKVSNKSNSTLQQRTIRSAQSSLSRPLGSSTDSKRQSSSSKIARSDESESRATNRFRKNPGKMKESRPAQSSAFTPVSSYATTTPTTKSNDDEFAVTSEMRAALRKYTTRK